MTDRKQTNTVGALHTNCYKPHSIH